MASNAAVGGAVFSFPKGCWALRERFPQESVKKKEKMSMKKRFLIVFFSWNDLLCASHFYSFFFRETALPINFFETSSFINVD